MGECDDTQQPQERSFVGVHMKCCNVYTRAYLNVQRDAFVGWCPRCAGQMRIRVVEEGGTDARFFEAS